MFREEENEEGEEEEEEDAAEDWLAGVRLKNLITLKARNGVWVRFKPLWAPCRSMAVPSILSVLEKADEKFTSKQNNGLS